MGAEEQVEVVVVVVRPRNRSGRACIKWISHDNLRHFYTNLFKLDFSVLWACNTAKEKEREREKEGESTSGIIVTGRHSTTHTLLHSLRFDADE